VVDGKALQTSPAYFVPYQILDKEFILMRKTPVPQNYHVCEITYLDHGDLHQDAKGAELLGVIQDLACEFINLRQRVKILETEQSILKTANEKLAKHIEVLEQEKPE
jgi:hypothetical protein